VFIGEQPGDHEDLVGEPFVGPAGRLLDRALVEAGIDRSSTDLTNAVKHFRFTRRDGGQRRIHEKPSARHVHACQPWLLAELEAPHPGSWCCSVRPPPAQSWVELSGSRPSGDAS